jgi:hypothetical protein
VFPDKNDESIAYYTSLHMFQSKSWFSIGIKPKAKDIKSFIDDLNQIEYLRLMQEIDTTIVLDSRKVRLGFESPAFDPLSEAADESTESPNRQLMQLLKVRAEGRF